MTGVAITRITGSELGLWYSPVHAALENRFRATERRFLKKRVAVALRNDQLIDPLISRQMTVKNGTIR